MEMRGLQRPNQLTPIAALHADEWFADCASGTEMQLAQCGQLEHGHGETTPLASRAHVAALSGGFNLS